MAEVEVERVLTLKERMALLNQAQVAGGLGPAENRPKVSARPVVPSRRPVTKQTSFHENTISTVQPPIANLPRGPPPPLPTRKAPPPLPARKESTDSSVSEPRVIATRTKSEENGLRVKAPAWGECTLPQLPAKAEQKAPTQSTTRKPSTMRTPSMSSMTSITTTLSNGSRQSLPPPLPNRRESSESVASTAVRRAPPVPSSDVLEKARKASFGANSQSRTSTEIVPPLPTRRPSGPTTQHVTENLSDVGISNRPPLIPAASRPDLSAIQASKPKVNGSVKTPSQGCLICRDFSAPDHHATLFPRQTVSSLQKLAYDLTAPFPSATDKARAIFTWLHHNIDYNTEAFFSGNLKASTPQSTLQSGLAVCEGYAALFTNIATYAGLESLVVSGHGKGFGFSALQPGSPLPPYEGNHAWNVVRIDEGWKLIDSCWGAGAVQGAGMPYCRRFAPERFTQSNEEFGLDHFPNNRDHFFLSNGRTLSWEDYIQRNSLQWPYQFEALTVFTNATTDYSIGQQTIQPPYRRISIHKQDTLRFQFGLFCPHWTQGRTNQGPPPVFFLMVGGIDGRDKHYVPLEHIKGDTPGGGGDMWYVDVNSRELGAPGETLTMFAVGEFGDRKNARGLTVQEFKNGIGRVGMSFVGVTAWELVA